MDQGNDVMVLQLFLVIYQSALVALTAVFGHQVVTLLMVKSMTCMLVTAVAKVTSLTTYLSGLMYTQVTMQ